jgi:hypothetical protein
MHWRNKELVKQETCMKQAANIARTELFITFAVRVFKSSNVEVCFLQTKNVAHKLFSL